eukprot:CAMPEP_0116017038 /NCGR_PEP_ID=MMETSP0321-20121206/7821_1 /TAXON_ID=163516 /ORGANISM="Leptocylindrus danicus var. danicus, Strain B650" /LENGTH=366 /DNA_ID=CAMNT_0003487177 /DNA_START=164 /DNA_END=1265 /DNA_ORIENTATION=-
MIKVVCNMTFNAVLSSPDAILCGEGLPAGLPVCVQMVRQKQQESKSSSKRRKKKDAVYFTVRTRDTSRIVQCFTLWPGPRVVCDHDDVPKFALFVTETAVRNNEKEKLIEYKLKRSVVLVFETVEEVRLFMQAMDYLKAGIQHMLQYKKTSAKSSKKSSRSSNSSKSSSASTATHLSKNDPTRGPASSTTVKFSNEEDASIVSALTGETFQAMSIDDSIKAHRRREDEYDFSSEEFEFFTVVIPAQVNVFKYTAPILDPSTHATDPMQLTCGGLSIVRLNSYCNLSRALLRLGFRNDDEIIEINNRFLAGRTWQSVCNIIGKCAAKTHQRGSYRAEVTQDVDIHDEYESIASRPSVPTLYDCRSSS